MVDMSGTGGELTLGVSAVGDKGWVGRELSGNCQLEGIGQDVTEIQETID